ncbi:ROK family transcriptional regulator [Alkalihalobacillus sp. LMS39]|uniref:ROK family transcriptional regulator n=1 Tax=Alkalihalobacillus sp. LMS39 TaxID=2924032 RepID=UPI001FB317B4|nr:ROK family transcriptional regulator [Alkalihalobacillus sp. LMS39]UOE94957.1 ROK family transcriptional regulator [Alkalihalobacillus sp. LMS39]
MNNAHVTGSFKLMKSLNRTLVLNIIRKDGPISRAEIAKRTNLTPPTVTNIVNELFETGIIKESQMGQSSGGRKPILLTIEPTSHYVIGIDVGVHKVKVVLADLNASITNETITKIKQGITEAEFMQLLIENVYTMLDQANVSKEKIVGIGVGMHGMVDHIHGVALYAPNLQLKNIPIKQTLEAEFSLPVTVENDAKALALGEKWFGYGADIENMVCINVGIGIGSGIILQNKLFHGKDGIAGEIGHTVIDENGPMCTCGNKGCLQTFSAGEAIRTRALEGINKGKATAIVEIVQGNLDKVDGEVVFKAAKAGDAFAKEVLTESGKYLGMSIANLINVLNPELVVLSGGVSRAGDFLLQPIRSIVEKRVLTPSAKDTTICLSKLGQQGTVIGAVTLVLAEMFVPDVNA